MRSLRLSAVHGADRDRAGRLAAWIATALVFIAPSVPIWLLQLHYFIDGPILNLEAGLAACLMVRWRRGGQAVLCNAWGAALVVGFSATYHFMRPGDFLASVAFARNLDLSAFGSFGLLLPVFPFVACAALCWWGVPRTSVSIRAAIFLALALLAVDTVNGSGAWMRATRIVSLNLAGSPVYTLAAQAAAGGGGVPTYRLPPSETLAATFDVKQWASRHPDRGIVFVIVESFGRAEDAQLRQWVTGRLFPAAGLAGYRLVDGVAPFKGATTAGELRQLCALGGSYSVLAPELAADCIPRQLQQLGWTTVGLHGFSSQMFNRQSWWPTIGLSVSHFADDDVFDEEDHCGAAFRGVCDDAVIRRAFAEAAQPSRFAYALTLNTHLPISRTEIPADLLPLCDARRISADGCQFFAGIGAVLASARAAAEQAAIKPLVVLVGDHAPPFASKEERDLFDQKHVPALVLVPTETPT